MESLRSDYHRPIGPPRWVVWATVPVVLALGFVAGMAIATYAHGAKPLQQAGNSVTTPTPHPSPSTDSTTSPPPTDSSWRIVTAPASTTRSSTTSNGGDVPGESGNVPTPTVQPFTGPANDIIDARKALAWDFGRYTFGGKHIDIEYQQMRQASGALGISVVGMISVEGYATWAEALRQEPEALQKWLTNAAERVLPASTRDRFHVAWAVVDVVREMPPDFADYEVTALDNRAFLVIRPLASSQDHTKAFIVLRPLDSLTAAGSGQKTSTTTPWAAYGPAIRFDTSDLYRPARVSGAHPLRP